MRIFSCNLYKILQRNLCDTHPTRLNFYNTTKSTTLCKPLCLVITKQVICNITYYVHIRYKYTFPESQNIGIEM